MALTPMFDTHQAVKELTEADFAEAQAEAVVATVSRSTSENVATKLDIAEVKADIASVRTDMAALEMRIIVKMTGVVLAIVSLGVAFLKLFP